MSVKPQATISGANPSLKCYRTKKNLYPYHGFIIMAISTEPQQ